MARGCTPSPRSPRPPACTAPPYTTTSRRADMAADPQDPPRHAGQVVRRVLLRRNIAIDAETAQLVAAAVQAALQAGAPSRPPRPRRRVPSADCEPLF